MLPSWLFASLHPATRLFSSPRKKWNDLIWRNTSGLGLGMNYYNDDEISTDCGRCGVVAGRNFPRNGKKPRGGQRKLLKQGAADRSEYRQAAGAVAQVKMAPIPDEHMLIVKGGSDLRNLSAASEFALQP